MTATIDTTKVTERRQVSFQNLADIRADIERLTANGEPRALGNWSPGQIFQHLANTMSKSIDGYQFKVPFPIRWIAGWFMKRRFLTKPMKAGFKLPKQAAEELISPPVPFADGLHNLKIALDRLEKEEKRSPSPVFGAMTREEWTQLHCRHAELHLSFLVS